MCSNEILTYTVAHTADLPARTTCFGRTPAGDVVFTTDAERYAAFVSDGVAVFSPREYEALVDDCVEGVVSSVEFAVECERKRKLPGGARYRRAWRGFRGPWEPRWWQGAEGLVEGHELSDGWTWGRLFAALGIDFVEVEVKGEAA